jgi:superfamily II DNA or RNA helicase
MTGGIAYIVPPNVFFCKCTNCLAAQDVVITTYGTLASDGTDGNTSLLQRIYWERVVLDEAHNIKVHRVTLAALFITSCTKYGRAE